MILVFVFFSFSSMHIFFIMIHMWFPPPPPPCIKHINFMFLGDYQESGGEFFGTTSVERLNEVCLQLCIFIHTFPLEWMEIYYNINVT